MSKYKVVNGTSYDARTSDRCIAVLENARLSNRRIRVWLGDANTGVTWNETCDVTGTIRRSTGTIKIPLLIANSRSSGGGGLLDHCIVRIMDTQTKRVLYTNKLFKMPQAVVKSSNEVAFPRGFVSGYCVLLDGAQFAYFATSNAALRFADFMTGKRGSR